MADPSAAGNPLNGSYSTPKPNAMVLPKEPFRSYQVIKTAPQLGWPTLKFLILPTGGTHPPSSPNLSYRTNRLSPNWLPWKWWLPPRILIYDGGFRKQRKADQMLAGKVRAGGGVGWNGVKITVDVMAKNGDPEAGGTAVITQRGWRRIYSFPIPDGRGSGGSRDLVWKGTKQAIHQLYSQDNSTPHSRRSPCNGNLKLTRADNPERILAIWENKTDWNVQGNLLIYEDFEERDLEIVIMGCLGVMSCERLTGKGMLGGFIKR
jgi:hypothetical protein